MSVQISSVRPRHAPTLLDDLVGVALGCYDAELARRAGGRALFDHLACLHAGRRRAPDGVGDAGAAALLDLDDIHWPSITHIGAIVWTVLSRTGVDGELRWRAAHAGYEVTARLGAALGPEHRRHWHATATAGTVGGAVAGAIALGSDPAAAAGHAVSVAGGSILCVLERTPTRIVHRDHAVDAALRCAGVAQLAPAYDGLEHPQGMFAAMGGSAERLLAPAAEPAIAAISFRRHWTSGFCHAAVEAAHELAPVGPDASVMLEVPAPTVALASIAHPRDEEEAWWSCQHAVAVTLLGLELGSSAIDDPRVVALRERITVQVGERSRVTVDGRVAERTAAAPLSDDDLRAKWRRLNADEPAPEELLR
ncbi:MAG TPA: MmgE/PrpD family protein [Solirubrobacteraceae bacterium]|nr:MmgE/PrpD family protein [Solirubrobacteraceae bacterium]